MIDVTTPSGRSSSFNTGPCSCTAKPLFDASEMAAGRYRLVFDVAAYFRDRSHPLPDPAFLDQVPLDFGIADTDGHYHLPLLVSPWSYSTHRGS